MDSVNAYDYSVSLKSKKQLKIKRLLLLLGYIVFGLVFFFGMFILKLYAVMVLVILFEWILVYFTWLYVCVDYKYEIEIGHIKFSTIYGLRKTKVNLNQKIKDFIEIKPARFDKTKNKETKSFDKIYDFCSGDKSEDRYCGIFNDEKGSRCIVYFDATQKALKLLKLYNSNTVISDTRF